MNWPYRIFQSGFSLIELSVAMAVFSMGLGSLSMMLLSSVYGTTEAHHQTVATVQARSLAEMIAMSSDAYGHYINPPGSDMAIGNMTSWQNHLRDELPDGDGLVCRDSTPDDGDAGDPSCDGSGAVVIKVFWTESRHADAEDDGQRRLVSSLPW